MNTFFLIWLVGASFTIGFTSHDWSTRDKALIPGVSLQSRASVGMQLLVVVLILFCWPGILGKALRDALDVWQRDDKEDDHED